MQMRADEPNSSFFSGKLLRHYCIATKPCQNFATMAPSCSLDARKKTILGGRISGDRQERSVGDSVIGLGAENLINPDHTLTKAV